MTPRWMVSLTLSTSVLLLGSLLEAAEPIESGHQPGESITAIFEPLNVTGDYAGQPHCMVCENGASPVAMIFAREPSGPLLQLLVEVDAATAKHRDEQMGSFVVFLSDDAALHERLEEVARKRKIEHLVLTIDDPAGPEGFKVSAEADLTIVLYADYEVKANHAFKKGDFTEASIPSIVSDLSKILSASK